MEIFQKEIVLDPKRRGFHLITDEILSKLPEISGFKSGIANLFLMHTSASLTINENVDPDVRKDFLEFINRAVPENEPYYRHILEGSDDMPAHIKSSLLGVSLSIPIQNGSFKMGIWQGIYLCEHRDNAGYRKIFVTVIGVKNEYSNT
ncbi:secondary thiamine-phosphate synthase enzyme YjbQ [Nitrosophilus alvini]|uniref:secondary thiamine-phosphate synthase enzyme YjbQ n=1 Tax=Nitrosophilus alvini TaxID=2714855 RepID=UPI00190CAEE8|nr:secondary thiamine-phosphate synthase enzyme YjbQ [Nitrosophilus alvini]